jgi:predicted nucleic acid-binding protein
MARETDTSYYDAAYLTEAKKKRVPLATEDRRLAEAAERNGVKTFNADSLSS